MTRWVAVGCVVASLVAAACGGTTETAGGSGGSSVVSEGPVAQDQLAQRYVDAVCNNSGPCCQKYGYSYDAAKCSAAGKAEMEQEFASQAANPALSYDPTRAGECVAWVKKIVAECTPSHADMVAMASACKAVFRGTKAQGETCSTDQECAGAETGSATCAFEFVDGGTYRACAPAGAATHGAKGQACNSTCRASLMSGDDCSGSGGSSGSGPTPGAANCWIEDGLQCDSKTYTCVELTPEGQPCSFSDVCVASAWCHSGTCVPKSQPGGDCGWSMMTDACVTGAYCDEGTSKCAAKVAEGAACSFDEQCTTTECDNGKCVPANVIANDETCGSYVSNEPPVPDGN